MNLAQLRIDYSQAGLGESDVDPDPIAQFRRWFDEALRAELREPNAMTLATSTPEGSPSARIVLLKDIDDAGFCFFTNYDGRKAREIASNPRAALLFFWAELERQVRIEGPVEMMSAEASDAYFRVRPRGSQIGAWASEQSRVIANRTVLEEQFAALEARFAGREVPRPEHWGGYRVRPELIEFWQGRSSRLHDRLRYRRSDSGWIIERLSP